MFIMVVGATGVESIVSSGEMVMMVAEVMVMVRLVI